MIDRLVHHAEVIAGEGDTYRIKDQDLERPTTATADDQWQAMPSRMTPPSCKEAYWLIGVG